MTGAETASALLQQALTPLRFEKAARHLKSAGDIHDFLAALDPLVKEQRAQILNGMRVYVPQLPEAPDAS